MSDEPKTFTNKDGVLLFVGPGTRKDNCVDISVVREIHGSFVELPIDLIGYLVQELGNFGSDECQMRLRRELYDKLWQRAKEKGITIGEMLDEAF